MAGLTPGIWCPLTGCFIVRCHLIADIWDQRAVHVSILALTYIRGSASLAMASC